VLFHPKTIPWFVSDVLPKDFVDTISALLDPQSFFEIEPPNFASIHDLKTVAARWKQYIDNGTFELSTSKELELGQPNAEADFWTSPWSFHELPSHDPHLLHCLQGAELVIFKGDLNYRKLTADLRWPNETEFEAALGPLAGKLSLLALRTCKADVIVGLKPGKAEELEQNDPRWKVSGQYAVIGFSAQSQT